MEYLGFIQRAIAIGEVSPASCLAGLDLTKQVNLLSIHHKQRSWIKTRKTGGGQLYRDSSPLQSKWVFLASSCACVRALWKKVTVDIFSDKFLVEIFSSWNEIFVRKEEEEDIEDVEVGKCFASKMSKNSFKNVSKCRNLLIPIRSRLKILPN